MEMIKVSANSRTSAVAGAIAGVVREHHRAEVQAIGAGAVNQALKALVLATGYLKNDGIFVSCVPEFADVTIEDKVRTAIKLVIEPSAASNFSSLSFASSD
jgi:stage V sporulation protein S